MDKYEYRAKTEQMLRHLEKKQYKDAMEIADSIDWRRVKNASMLNTVSEIYEYNGEFQKGREVLLQAFDRAPASRKVVYRLGTLALKINDVKEATACYEEFISMAPKDPNQYILRYKILRTQGAPVSEQIAALEEFKKAEYIEKWAYELAKLYDEAEMTAECLEECDDLILWFSEGKYVYLAMELKMKYKPLTPLQQEKYDSRPGAVKKRPAAVTEPPKSTLEEVDDDNEVEEEEEVVQEVQPEVVETQETPEAEVVETEAVEAETVSPVQEAEIVEEKPVAAPVAEEKTPVAAKAAASVAKSINIEEKAMKKKEDDILAAGQMMIDDILMKWEAKQKVNEEAIAKQKAEDEERLQKEREQARIKQEEERKAAEEAAKKAAEEEAARKAAEEAAKKAAEEEAARKAAEEAAKKAAEEEAARKAAEEAAKKAAEEEAARKAAEEAAKKAAEEEAARKAAEESAKKAAEEEAARKATEEEAAKKVAEEVAKIAEQNQEATGKTQRIPDDIVRLMEQMESEDEESEEDFFEDDFEEMTDMEADFIDGIEEELADMDQNTGNFPVGELKEDTGEDDSDEADFEEAEFDEEDFEEADFEEADFEEADFQEAGEADSQEESSQETDEADSPEAKEVDFEESELEEAEFGEEDFEEADFDEADFEEAEFDEEDFEEADFDEADFEETAEEIELETEEAPEMEADFEEAEVPEVEADVTEVETPEVDEADFEEDFQDVDDAETDFDDGFEAGDFEEATADEDDFEEDFEEEDFDEADFDEADFEEDSIEEEPEEEEELVIEEPSEEEIQERIRKSKGMGVPFDTGFVVTGRYDLSATSEIGLKAGLTEEQKKLFSYFVPVRGMSEQIVEVLDNDRRAQREGTSKTGNLLVIGRKGSGKTVLAVDIVKAIQKQRNLKQGKVAIVTGESLNKKELTNIIQKLRGGAIIIEGAGKLNSRTVKELNYLMEKKTGELLFVLEDQRKPLERLMTANPDFKKKFSSRLELPVFINDELVTFGQTYAKENGYKLDEMGILALYSRIDVMQREDHAVSVAEVKEIMDAAISHSQRANVKHLARRVFGKGTDSSDRIILKEEDFRF